MNGYAYILYRHDKFYQETYSMHRDVCAYVFLCLFAFLYKVIDMTQMCIWVMVGARVYIIMLKLYCKFRYVNISRYIENCFLSAIMRKQTYMQYKLIILNLSVGKLRVKWEKKRLFFPNVFVSDLFMIIHKLWWGNVVVKKKIHLLSLKYKWGKRGERKRETWSCIAASLVLALRSNGLMEEWEKLCHNLPRSQSKEQLLVLKSGCLLGENSYY